MSAERRLRADPPAPADPTLGPGLRGTGAFPLRRIRCQCAACGVHTIVTVCVTISGCCRNCGSYDMRRVPGDASDR